MKSSKLIFLILAVSFVLLPLLNSCSSAKMAALPCPEPVKHNNLRKVNKKDVNQKYYARNKTFRYKKNSYLFASNSGRKDSRSTDQTKTSSLSNTGANEPLYIGAPALIESQGGPNLDYGYSLVRIEDNTIPPVSDSQNNNISLPVAATAECDTIILKSGKMYLGKVAEIGAYEIRYRRCDNLDGPVIVLRKAELTEIRYQNGSKEIFTDTDEKVNQMPYPPAFSPVVDQRKVEGLGLAGFVASLVGLFIAGIPLGIIAVIFGLVSLSKIKKQPGRFKGRGFAIASFIIGMVDIVAMIILIAVAV